MIISGIRKRSIADQKNTIDFAFRVTPNQVTGSYFVGLSGATTVFGLSLASGQIYDPNNQFVGTYQNQVPVSLSGQLNQRSFDLWIDDRLVCLGQPWRTGVYSWLLAQAKLGSFDFQGGIKGLSPNYSIQETGKYVSSGSLVSGRIVNNDPTRAFRIFNAFLEQTDAPYSILDFTTGNITNTGRIIFESDLVGLQDYVLPVVLDTNFGQVRYNFTISGDYSVVPDIYLNISPDSLNIPEGVAKNYSVQVSNFPSGTRVGVRLDYNAGITGNIYFFQNQVRTGFSGNYSGAISGCGYLQLTTTGLVSGLDPKTSIFEIGTGTGILKSSLICATGFSSGNYVTRLSGFGSGIFELNYLASGLSYGNFKASVPLTGAYVVSTGFNFAGTGNNPGIATGLVPLGTGRVLAYPTGCFAISSGLVLGTDYFSGILFYNQVFSGPLSIPYRLTAVGYATGDYIQGVVDSNFIKNFEQGEYRFSKFYSGIVHGRAINTGTFDPATCLDSAIRETSGVISNTFFLNTILDCSNLTSISSIIVTGFPAQVFDSEGNLLQPNNVVLVKPSGGFSVNERLEFSQSGNYTRTTISNSGVTVSGSGYFNQVVNECNATGVWKGTIATTSGTAKLDSVTNTFKTISSTIYLSGSGRFDKYASNSGAFATKDSGVIYFEISGAGAKTLAFKALNLQNEANRSLEFYLFKNSIPSEIWAAEGINDSMAFRQWRTEVMSDVTAYSDTVVVLENMTSGIYALYVMSKPVPAPIVYFKQAVFSGCESSQNIRIDVAASGLLRQAIWFSLLEYEELTAHSGRNYNPVFVPSGYFLPSTSGEQIFSFTIPIIDDHNFGKDHEFLIRLGACSGCEFALGGQEATVRILENDNGPLPTGLYQQNYPVNSIGLVASGTGFITGDRTFDCSVVPVINPPEPPRPRNPSDPSGNPNCAPCTQPPCCECESVVLVSGTCPTYPGVFYGFVPSGSCGSVSAGGTESTNGYIYAGEICSALGTSFEGSSAGNCDIDVQIIPEGCLFPLTNGNVGCAPSGSKCPEIGSEWSISGCNDDFSLCSGSLGGGTITGSGNATGLTLFSTSNCPDFAQYVLEYSGNNLVKKHRIGEPCKKEHVFVKATCPDCHEISWAFSGSTVPRNPNIQLAICPPPLI